MPAAAPAPPAISPVQIPSAQVAVRVAVDGSPEENVFRPALLVLSPTFGNELLVLEQVVEDVDVQYGLALKFFAKLLVSDGLFLCLIGREMRFNPLTVEEEVVAIAGELALPLLLVRLDLPILREERVLVAVDDVLDLPLLVHWRKVTDLADAVAKLERLHTTEVGISEVSQTP